MLVLKGNIPRFSWEPSTTMLTNRLKGTTEVSVSNQAGHLKRYCFLAIVARDNRYPPRRPNLRFPRRTHNLF
jgi:hypothetical protein